MQPFIPAGGRFAVILALSFLGIGALSAPSPVAAQAQYIVQPVGNEGQATSQRRIVLARREFPDIGKSEGRCTALSLEPGHRQLRW